MTDPGAKQKMSDPERTELMKKMDKDLEEHFAMLEAKAAERGPRTKMVDGWTEDNWEDEMQKHPFFNNEWQEGKELSPLMQGLQDLKYSPDENTPEELAKSYKEDGNFNFKCKKFRFAVASYTEGLKAKSEDKEVNTQLVTNRAAAQFHIGNYRSSLRDCETALRISATHMKAVLRGAQCCSKLKHYKECIEWCDKGLEVDSTHTELLKLRAESVQVEKAVERDARKRLAAEKREKQEHNTLLELIRQRGIKVQSKGSSLTLSDLEPCHPAAVQKRVRLQDGVLVWPVLFLYPEIGETDFIEEFRETDRFADHLEVMFGAQVDRPPWDQQGRYSPQSVVIYFEDQDANLVCVPSDWTLTQAITNKRFALKAGTPGFIILVKDSKAHKDFLTKYSLVK
eukprot:GFUD01042327.1.p1 GENE.GFUD01042327.1~~GFUD01042327.1.p1  ORF type:complete len:397 (+),score=144.01 GFUD01042327.1:95-1285(+)